ncbi:MAG: oxidoreductase [Actinomycetota bacterium]|nr:oxidoreductase [Actinomycetota bacterium]
MADQSGRRVVVTGANSGIGLAAATELARHGAEVTLAVRDEAKGRRAASGMPGRVEVRRLDLADLSSVRAFAEAWDGSLDVLVDNAGVMATPRGRTVDGFELQFGTNHLGHFALTNLLLAKLTDRVVVVSSLAHGGGRIDLDDLNWDRRRYRAWRAYAQSKLANLLFVWELQRKLEQAGSPLLALAAHPGYAATELQTRTGSPIYNLASHALNHLVAQSAEDGALPTLFAATEDLPGRTYVGPGGFMEIRGAPRVVGRSGAASDDAVAERLWDASEQLTGVSFPL